MFKPKISDEKRQEMEQIKKRIDDLNRKKFIETPQKIDYLADK